MKNLRAVFVVLTVVVALSACGARDVGDQPPAEETAVLPASEGHSSGAATTPAEEPVPTAPSAEEDLNLSSLTDGLAGLGSYKSRFTMSFVGKDEQGLPVNGTWAMEEDLTQQPAAQRTAISASGFSEEEAAQPGTFEVITVGDATYWITQDADGTRSCMSMSSSEPASPQQGAMFTPDMMGSISDAKYKGTETVNGVRAKHYAWQENSLPLLGFSSVEGNVWMATDGDYVVKYTAEASGKGILFGSTEEEGTITFEYNLTDVNGSFTIEAPAECEAPATDIPVMPDAQDKSTFGEMVTYSSPSALADVVAFYQAEMPKNGWQASGEPTIAEGFATLEFAKEGRTAQLILSYDTDARQTSVMVTIAKQE